MRVLKIFSRIYVNDMESALEFYQNLMGQKADMRFRYPEMNLELASVGDLLILAGSEDALKPFRETKATFKVDSIEEFKNSLEQTGARIISGPKKVPTGFNMTVKHPDGTRIEYVQHT